MTHQTPDPALAAEQMPAVPELRLVPVEPTEEMLLAVLRRNPGSLAGYALHFAADYAAALAAAPSASDAPSRRPLGCALAMRVMQSDLYPSLDAAERADCDELVQQNVEWFKAASDARQPEQPDSVHVTAPVPAGAPTTHLPLEGTFRKKPVAIHAIQYTEAIRDAYLFDKVPLPAGVSIPSHTTHPPTRKVWSACAYINTLEGRMEVTLGDWIITGVKGEHYACKPDIFAATYEPVDGGAVEARSEPAQPNKTDSSLGASHG